MPDNTKDSASKRPNGLRRWTPEEDARLTALVECGFKSPAIALRLKRSGKAVQLRCQRLNLLLGGSTHLWAPAFQRPHTLEGLAAEWGITRNGVVKRKRLCKADGFTLLRASQPRPRGPAKTPSEGTKHQKAPQSV